MRLTSELDEIQSSIDDVELSKTASLKETEELKEKLNTNEAKLTLLTGTYHITNKEAVSNYWCAVLHLHLYIF